MVRRFVKCAAPALTLDIYTKFNKVRTLILQEIHAQPGLTYEQIGKQILRKHGFLPRVGNRIRELREQGMVWTVKEEDGRLHVYPQTR